MCHLYSLIVLAIVGATPADSGPISAPATPASDNFRIDNAVFAGDRTEPPCESSTIFCDGIVYDCMKDPAETIVFNSHTGRFTLLNVGKQTRAELTTKELIDFSDWLRRNAFKSSDQSIRFLAAPKFDVRFDRFGNELSLDSTWVKYHLTVLPVERPTTVEQYREFSDWCARLKPLLSPGSPPPFGRMAVNAELADRHAIPKEVTLTLVSLKESNRQQRTIGSEHRLVRLLEQADYARMADARQQMSRFKRVTFEQYRKGELR